MAQQHKSKLVRFGTLVLFGFLVLSFGLWGIGDIFRGGGQTEVVARVGAQEITRQAYEQSLEREVRALQQSTGQRLSRDQLAAIGIAQRALAPLIQQALLSQVADDRGLVVTQAQLLEQIRREPSFQRNGTFDTEAYRVTLRNANLSEQQFLAMLTQDVARESIFDPLTEAVQVPDAAAKLLFAYLAETRTAQFVLVDSAAMSGLAAPSETELKEVYEDYAADFQAPEYRAITLLHLAPADFFHEVEVTEAEARERYEATKASFDQPEQRALRQVVFDDQAAAETALTELATGKTLDEIATARGSAVAEIALQSKAQLAAVLPALAEAAFALPEGERFGIAETLLGFHLFEIARVEPGKASSFEEVQAQVTDKIRQERATEAMESVATQIDEEFVTGATLDEVAERLSLTLVTIPAIDRDGKDRAGAYVEALPSPPELLPLLFESDDTGLDSLLAQARDGSYFAYRVDSITPPATRPYAEVATQVAALAERLGRDRLAKEKAEALAAELKAKSKTLDQIATENGWTLETSQPMTRFDSEPAKTPAAGLPALLFATAVGEPVTVAADGGTIVAVLTEVKVTKAEDDPERFQNLKDSYRRALVGDMGQQMSIALRDEYPVEIYEQLLEASLDRY